MKKYSPVTPTDTVLTPLPMTDSTSSFHSSLPRGSTRHASSSWTWRRRDDSVSLVHSIEEMPPPTTTKTTKTTSMMKPLSSSCLRYGCYRQHQTRERSSTDRPFAAGDVIGKDGTFPGGLHRSMESVANRRPNSLNLSGSGRALVDAGVDAKGGRKTGNRNLVGSRTFLREV